MQTTHNKKQKNIRLGNTPKNKMIISIANQKGGVGKTTSTYVLGNILAEKHKTLLIDLDRGDLTDLFGIDPKESLYDTLINQVSIQNVIVQSNQNPNLYLLPGDIRLVSLERHLIQKIRPDNLLNKELSKIKNQFKYILIDCPGALDLRMINALTTSNYCLIAVQTEPHSYKAIPYLLEVIEEVKENINPSLDYRLLATMHNKRTTLAKNILELLYETYKDKTLQTPIHIDNKMRLQSITKKVPTSARATEEYRNLVEEILKLKENT